MSLYSTPQDYLEKIFQIPFALRPVEKDGYHRLVNDLLRPLPAREKQMVKSLLDTKPISGKVPTQGVGLVPALGKQTDAETDKSIQKSPESGIPQAEEKKEESFTPIPPQQLEFKEWEQEDIQQLWFLFHTPRTVKRFINIYRLIRAGLSSDEEVKTFEGTRNKPGDYQVVLLLLAAITAFPNEASQFLYRLDAWLDRQESKNRRSAVSWKEVIGFLKKEAEETNDEKLYATRQRNQNSKQLLGQLIDDNVTGMGRTDGNQTTASAWYSMLDCLDRTTHDGITKKPFKLTTLRTWSTRVARFSFSVQPT